jgi:CRISPR/Cas system CSM-associated protein Csm3 (group 7 of RAMP superfamily)
LVCQTPLAIRNGLQIAYSDAAPTKTRYRNLRLAWQATQETDHAVAALHYGYEIRDGAVHSFHFVPPSSVRGALRSWTIRHLVHPTLRGAFTPTPSEALDEALAYQAILKQGLAQRDSGCELIASLFGLAADDAETGAPANAGRLSIATEKFAEHGLRPVDVSGETMAAAEGPDNVRRQMPVRNPLDRMTHASRAGGLHRFLEVARGQAFRVHLRILNPLDCDLGLLGLWVRELNDGMLRIGALSSIGRGRVAVREQSYELWRRPNAPLLECHAQLSEAAAGSRRDDILAGLWTGTIVPPESLTVLANQYLADYTGGGGDASLS